MSVPERTSVSTTTPVLIFVTVIVSVLDAGIDIGFGINIDIGIDVGDNAGVGVATTIGIKSISVSAIASVKTK